MLAYFKYLFHSPDGRPSKTAFMCIMSFLTSIVATFIVIFVDTPSTRLMANSIPFWGFLGLLVSSSFAAYVAHNRSAAIARFNGGNSNIPPTPSNHKSYMNKSVRS